MAASSGDPSAAGIRASGGEGVSALRTHPRAGGKIQFRQNFHLKLYVAFA